MIATIYKKIDMSRYDLKDLMNIVRYDLLSIEEFKMEMRERGMQDDDIILEVRKLTNE